MERWRFAIGPMEIKGQVTLDEFIQPRVKQEISESKRDRRYNAATCTRRRRHPWDFVRIATSCLHGQIPMRPSLLSSSL